MMAAPLIDISQDQWAVVKEALERHFPNAYWFGFGSRAKWTAKEHSDLDIAIDGRGSPPGKKLYLLQDELADSALPFRVDIIDLTSVAESFFEAIQHTLVPLFESCSLGELGRVITGRTPPGTLHGAFNGGVLFVTPSDMVGQKTITDTGRRLSAIGLASVKNAQIPAGSVMVSCIGSDMGKVALAGAEAVTNQQINSVVLEKGDDPDFLYYSLVPRKQELQALARGGSAQPILNKTAFSQLRVPLPPRRLQRDIVRPLVFIDERIEILKKSSETLEAIARAIFKSWFVDFDPVKAKAEGREPEGMDAATAALFPGEFQESAVGRIPKGWALLPLDAIATFLNGLALQKFPLQPGETGLPAIKIAQLKARSTAGADQVSLGVPEEYLVHDGDLLFSWSGSLEVDFWCGGDGALNQHLFKVSSHQFPRFFYYFSLREHLPAFREIAADKATTMGHIQRRHLHEALIAAPPSKVLRGGAELIEPLIERAILSRLQQRTLANLRDTLLPRLISGKLRVPEAEEMLAGVV